MNVNSDEHISSYAQIVHALYVECTLNLKEVEDWMDEFGCEVLECNKDKISFLFKEGPFVSKMTIFSSGRIFIDSGLDDIQ